MEKQNSNAELNDSLSPNAEITLIELQSSY